MTKKLSLVPVIALLMVAAGCDKGQGMTYGKLPVHQLDWGRSSTGTVKPASSGKTIALTNSPYQRSVQTQTGGYSEWASNGYRDWRYIVIHHSASPSGCAAAFDAEHRRRGWDELGYHFVIDNGNGGPDGMIEVGPRWRTQKWGAHTGKTPGNEYNNHGIGICLVGDFSRTLPSPVQLASLNRLVSYLSVKYGISTDNIIGHRDAPGASTECPGDALENYIRSHYQSMMARR